MSKERLEEIKRFFDNFIIPVGRNQPTRKHMSALIAHESINWLIQQAEERIQLEERVEELEEELYELNESAIEIQNDFLNTNGEKNRLKERVKKLEEEREIYLKTADAMDKTNQRYKQALEEILIEKYGSEGIDAERELERVIDIAIQALQGGNENE